jgi:hypothetical protein
MKSVMCAALVLVGCGKSSEPADTETPVASRKDKPVVDTADKPDKRFCKRIDEDAIAKLIEIAGLSRTGGGTLVKGGSEPATLSCSYYERGKTEGGMSFGFNLKAVAQLENAETLGKFSWEPFEAFGKPAKIGRASDAVHLQTVTNGVQLITRLGHPSVPVADLEKRLLAATQAVIDQLPADATSEIR